MVIGDIAYSRAFAASIIPAKTLTFYPNRKSQGFGVLRFSSATSQHYLRVDVALPSRCAWQRSGK